jgi:hypothetical protein
MPATSEKLETVPPEFIFVGEHSALDFANTIVVTNGQETDYLRTWADMIDWFSLTGLSVDPGLKLSAARGAEALKSGTSPDLENRTGSPYLRRQRLGKNLSSG